jgi:hypothetical protein
VTASQKPQLCCVSIVEVGVSALSPAGTSDITSGLRPVKRVHDGAPGTVGLPVAA